MLQVGLSGFFRGNIGGNVGFGCGNGCCLALDAGFLLDVLDGSDDFTLLDLLAFLDVEVGDAAHGRGAEIDVVLGFDLAGAADDGGQILLDDLGGQHLGITRLLPDDEASHKACDDQYDKDD